MSPIDRDARLPFYEQLAAILRAQINSGDMPSYPWMPGKPKLVQDYGVSQGTVERALGILREEGLIEWIRGKGYYILTSQKPHS